MSGLIVEGVKRAIAFEVEQGERYKVAMDRLWMWRVCGVVDSPTWKLAMTNHYLHVQRENRAIPCTRDMRPHFSLTGHAIARGAGGGDPLAGGAAGAQGGDFTC